MKNNKNTKTFNFTTLQYYQDYDKYTDEMLINLIRIHPSLNSIIKSIKNYSLSIPDKISLLCSIFKLIHYKYFNDDDLTYLSERIGNKIFGGTEEYKYRKQFAEQFILPIFGKIKN